MEWNSILTKKRGEKKGGCKDCGRLFVLDTGLEQFCPECRAKPVPAAVPMQVPAPTEPQAQAKQPFSTDAKIGSTTPAAATSASAEAKPAEASPPVVIPAPTSQVMPQSKAANESKNVKRPPGKIAQVSGLIILCIVSVLVYYSVKGCETGTGSGIASGTEILIKCADESTSYEQEKCQKQYTGKTMEFSGTVDDVTSITDVKVRLDAGNYADVTFQSNVGDALHKDNAIRFTGTIRFVGTGVMFHHKIVDANLL
jgi:hypothetical protein